MNSKTVKKTTVNFAIFRNFIFFFSKIREFNDEEIINC